jgi:hypothetical protein
MNPNYLIIIIIILTIFYFSYIAYFKIRYKFWSLQPVNHYHNFLNKFKENKIVQMEMPIKNKYVNLFDIKLYNENELSNLSKTNVLSLLRTAYLTDPANQVYYRPKDNNFLPYLINNSKKSVICVYIKPCPIITENQRVINIPKELGLITSKYMNLFINKTYYESFYVDFLVVDKKNRKQNIAPSLIQTLYYHQRHLYPKIHINIFKREDSQNFIKPIVRYLSYGYDLDLVDIDKKRNEMNISYFGYEARLVDKKTYIDFYTYLKSIMNNFDLLYLPCVSNLLELINSKNYIVFTIHKYTTQQTENVNSKSNILGFYIFKNNTCYYYNKNSISLICSYWEQSKLYKEEFLYMFLNVLNEIKKYFPILIIEDITYNNILIKSFSVEENNIIIESSTGYYFYNFISKEFSKERTLFLT